jgi:hypothetical protein
MQSWWRRLSVAVHSHTVLEAMFDNLLHISQFLVLFHSLKCGWSTVSAKYSARQRTASPMHNDPPRKLLAKFEVNRVNSIVSEIERFQKMDELRIL